MKISRSSKHILFIFTIFSLSFAQDIFACPLVPFKNTKEIINPASNKAQTVKKKFIDYNCDQKLEITFIGDSIVYGRGDSVNGNKGGYVVRLQKKFEGFNKKKQVRFNAIGYPGIHSAQLFSKVKRIYDKRKKDTKTAFNKLKLSDIIVIDAGRNDYWDYYHEKDKNDMITMDEVAHRTAFNIKRTIDFLYEVLPTLNKKHLVFISSSNQIPVARGYQVPFIKVLNKYLNASSYTKIHQNLNVNLLSGDGLHPSSKGYVSLANSLFKQLKNKTGMQALLKNNRPDRDSDGIPDLFESHRYATNVKKKDSDSDGLTDFDELYIYQTSPNDFDTDGDGYGDGNEIKMGTDPLDPLDPMMTATPTYTPIVTNTPTNTSTSTPTWTPTPTSTSTLVSTPTPTLTPTLTPTPTLDVTSTPTPTPTETLEM